MEPKGPYLKVIKGGDEVGHICDLMDKWCLVEHDQECEVYNEWKEEHNVET